MSFPTQIGMTGVSLFSVWASAANKFYARFVRIQEDRGHTVVSRGPYRYVRHPAYLGMILAFAGNCLVLGSWWSALPVTGYIVLLLRRTVFEDRTLRDQLPGYLEYAHRVRFRLLPGVW